MNSKQPGIYAFFKAHTKCDKAPAKPARHRYNNDGNKILEKIPNNNFEHEI